MPNTHLFDNLNDEVIADLLLDNDPSDLTENRQLLSHTLASLEILPKDLIAALLLHKDRQHHPDVFR